PTHAPMQGTFGGGTYDAFVAQLSGLGSVLLYSTYLGGSGDDIGYGIAVDSAGSAYVTGLTASGNFPTVGAVQGTNGGGGDAFVAKVSVPGPGVISTLAGTGTAGFSGDGGPAFEAQLNTPSGVAADPLGDVYIVDSANNRIREVAASTGIITTVAGGGTGC